MSDTLNETARAMVESLRGVDLEEGLESILGDPAHRKAEHDRALIRLYAQSFDVAQDTVTLRWDENGTVVTPLVRADARERCAQTIARTVAAEHNVSADEVRVTFSEDGEPIVAVPTDRSVNVLSIGLTLDRSGVRFDGNKGNQ